MFSRWLKDRSGTSALEFAIIAPVFLFMIMAMLAYGIYFGAAHSVQQVAANAARAAVAGLDADERRELALIQAEASVSNGLLRREPMDVSVSPHPGRPEVILVTVTYDAKHLPIWDLGPPIPMPDKTIRKVSAISAGGY